MKKNICVIYDEDEKFIAKFMEVISRKNKMPFRIMAFTRKEAFIEYIAANSSDLDLTVIGEQYFCDEIESCINGRIMLLCEETAYSGCDCAESRLKRIFRYQSSENLLREILAYLPERTEQEGAQVTGIYSPVNASSKTSLALAVAGSYAEQGSVLYINLEEFSGLGEILDNAANGDLSDVIYYYRTSPRNFTKEIENIVGHKGKISYIPPLKCAQDIFCLTSAEMADMISCIAKNCGYERIVLDISNAVKEPWKLIEICSRTFVPIKEDYISKKKISDFETYILSLGHTEIYDRIEKIQVPFDEEELLTPDFIEKFGWSRLGRFARELAYG